MQSKMKLTMKPHKHPAETISTDCNDLAAVEQGIESSNNVKIDYPSFVIRLRLFTSFLVRWSYRDMELVWRIWHILQYLAYQGWTCTVQSSPVIRIPDIRIPSL